MYKREGGGILTGAHSCRFSLLLRIWHWQRHLLLVFVGQKIVKPGDSGVAIQKEHTIWWPTFHYADFEASLGDIAALMLTFSHFTTFSCYPIRNPGTAPASSLQQVYKGYFHLADEGFPWTPGINYKNPENLLGPLAQVYCTFGHGSSPSWHRLHHQSPSPLGIAHQNHGIQLWMPNHRSDSLDSNHCHWPDDWIGHQVWSWIPSLTQIFDGQKLPVEAYMHKFLCTLGICPTSTLCDAAIGNLTIITLY